MCRTSAPCRWVSYIKCYTSLALLLSFIWVLAWYSRRSFLSGVKSVEYCKKWWCQWVIFSALSSLQCFFWLSFFCLDHRKGIQDVTNLCHQWFCYEQLEEEREWQLKVISATTCVSEAIMRKKIYNAYKTNYVDQQSYVSYCFCY